MKEIDLQNYMYYKCRSSLAYDVGGTVYDITSKRMHENCYNENNSCTNKEFLYKPEQDFNKVVPIFNDDKSFNNIKRTQDDSPTHLDDDKFNEYEVYSCENIKKEPSSFHNGIEFVDMNKQYPQSNYYFSNDSLTNLTYDNENKEIINQDNFMYQSNNFCQISNNLSSSFDIKDSNDNIKPLVSKVTEDCDYQESNFQYLSDTSFNGSNVAIANNYINKNENVNSSLVKKEETHLKNLHFRKRKQVYSIKDDSELIEERKNVFSVNGRQSTSAKFGKCNPTCNNYELQYEEINPFANKKMNSILKGSDKFIKKESSTGQYNSYELNFQNSEPEDFSQEKLDSAVLKSFQKPIEFDNTVPKQLCSSNFICGQYSTGNLEVNVLQDSNSPSEFNSLNSSQFQYSKINLENHELPQNILDPEQSCQDLSPIVQHSTVGFKGYETDENNSVLKINPIKENLTAQYCSIGSNNDTFPDNISVVKLNSKLNDADYFDYVQPRERIVESNIDKLLSPTLEYDGCQRVLSRPDIKIPNHAYNFGNRTYTSTYETFSYLQSKNFNTSNNSVIDEILYDVNFAYKNINLEFDVSRKNEMQAKQKFFISKTINPISCTLIESLNEFNRFGGFLNICNNNENFNSTFKSEEEIKKNGIDNVSINTYNFNSATRYFNPEINTISPLKKNVDANQTIKIKINRIDDNNHKSVLCDPKMGKASSFQKSKLMAVKDIERYECHECFQKFRTKRILITHISDFHKGPYDVECDICRMKFKKSSAHKNHYPWCKKNVNFKCDICPKIYRYQASLNKHKKTHYLKNKVDRCRGIKTGYF